MSHLFTSEDDVNRRRTWQVTRTQTATVEAPTARDALDRVKFVHSRRWETTDLKVTDTTPPETLREHEGGAT